MLRAFQARMVAFARPTSPVALLATVATWPLLTYGFLGLLRSSECVAGQGLVGFAAANLAQMRPVADCPTGTLGYGPHTATMLGVLAALLAAIVLANIAAAVVGHWLSTAVRATVRVLARLMGRRRPLPAWTSAPSTQGRVIDWLASAAVARPPHRRVLRRGPPLPAH